MVRAMTYRTMIHGGLTNTHGSCPGCGAEVPRVHAWNSAQARDAYRCPTCGTFEYATGGAQLPGDQEAQGGPTAAPMMGQASGLTSVLDAADCVG